MKVHLCLVVFATLLLTQSAYAQRSEGVVPPSVPDDIWVSPDEFTPFLAAHAVGTQGYVCVAIGTSYGWVAFGPHATLFNADGEQVLTHFLSPAPYDLLPTPTWEHSRDSSVVWARVLKSSSDANYVAPNSVPWLLLEAVVVGDGPTGGEKLLATRRIQRVNTFEGKAPATGCAAPADIGKRGLVPYEADYYFYKEKPARYSNLP